jgi:hypothetical protein
MAPTKFQLEESKKPNPRYVLELRTIRRMIQEADDMDKGLRTVLGLKWAPKSHAPGPQGPQQLPSMGPTPSFAQPTPPVVPPVTVGGSRLPPTTPFERRHRKKRSQAQPPGAAILTRTPPPIPTVTTPTSLPFISDLPLDNHSQINQASASQGMARVPAQLILDHTLLRKAPVRAQGGPSTLQPTRLINNGVGPLSRQLSTAQSMRASSMPLLRTQVTGPGSNGGSQSRSGSMSAPTSASLTQGGVNSVASSSILTQFVRALPRRRPTTEEVVSAKKWVEDRKRIAFNRTYSITFTLLICLIPLLQGLRGLPAIRFQTVKSQSTSEIYNTLIWCWATLRGIYTSHSLF